MRDVLALLEGHRGTWRATVARLGNRPRLANLRESTVLLRHVAAPDGAVVADHLWLRLGVRLARLDPRPGDVIEFTAVVRRYVKGRVRLPDGTITPGYEDFKLANPAHARRLARSPEGSA